MYLCDVIKSKRFLPFLITIAVLLLLGGFGARAQSLSFPDEELHYKVTFKWGLIQKQAGTATLKLRSQGSDFKATLYARSDPWADRIYQLRDTLTSLMSGSDMLPIRYERIAHEEGKYSRDIINFRRAGNAFNATCTRYRQRDADKPMTVRDTSLYAEGVVVDMLSVFYYLRTIDYTSFRPKEYKNITIFSGKRKENLRIKFEDIQDIKVEDKRYNTYHLSFVFTTEGGKESSDPINVWITTAPPHIPVKLEGSLKVGKIRCLYTGQ
ncbi:MAG: DUF3108 domain-containing protein [Bacteroidales bacterium]|nr:DUF3108 domain-containing protein [Bacteroidales bacterium]